MVLRKIKLEPALEEYDISEGYEYVEGYPIIMKLIDENRKEIVALVETSPIDFVVGLKEVLDKGRSYVLLGAGITAPKIDLILNEQNIKIIFHPSPFYLSGLGKYTTSDALAENFAELYSVVAKINKFEPKQETIQHFEKWLEGKRITSNMKPKFSWTPSDKVMLEVILKQKPYRAIVHFEEFLAAVEELDNNFYPRVKPEEGIKSGKERFYELLSSVKKLWQKKSRT